MRAILCLLFLSVAFTVSFAAEGGRAALLKELMRGPADCAKRVDNPTYPIFHGCYDWHSAVHAHWAILRVANALDEDLPEARWVESVLRADAVQREASLLAETPSWENPYGRSWFLQLAREFEGWARKRGVMSPERLRPLASQLAESIVQSYRESPPSPASVDYDNASWALYQVFVYAKHVGDAQLLATTERLIQDFFVRSPLTLGFNSAGDGFFSVFGNWAYLVLKTAAPDVAADFLASHPISSDELEPSRVTDTHSLGLVWSRAWALKALARNATTPDRRAELEQAYRRHVRQGLSNHRLYRDDYDRYGHWVAQFAIYALTDGTE